MTDGLDLVGDPDSHWPGVRLSDPPDTRWRYAKIGLTSTVTLRLCVPGVCDSVRPYARSDQPRLVTGRSSDATLSEEPYSQSLRESVPFS